MLRILAALLLSQLFLLSFSVACENEESGKNLLKNSQEQINLTINIPPESIVFPQTKIEVPPTVVNVQPSEVVFTSLPFWQDPKSIISLIALTISGLHLIWTVLSKKAEHKNSVKDEYWLRKVIFPKITAPLNEVWNAANRLKTETSDNEDFFIAMLPFVGDLRDSFEVLTPLQMKNSEKVHGFIDEFEERINDYQGENPLELVSELQNKIIHFLINEVHLKLQL